MRTGDPVSHPRRHRSSPPGFVLCLAVVAFLAFGAMAAVGGESPTESAHYRRADPTVIRSELRDILEDPRYAPRRSFWQWLTGHLSDWEMPELPAFSGLAEVLVWALMIWCVLALIAIVGHLLWILLQRFFGRGSAQEGVSHGLEPTSPEELSYEELRELEKRYAAEGDFRRAASMMLVALLTLLDATEAIHFHPSKTNGEYAREYTPAKPGREAFRRFVRSFDTAVYGPAGCDESDYSMMLERFQEVRSRVQQRA